MNFSGTTIITLIEEVIGNDLFTTYFLKLLVLLTYACVMSQMSKKLVFQYFLLSKIDGTGVMYEADHALFYPEHIVFILPEIS